MGWGSRYEEPHAHALYLHVPFCRQKCAYCDFHSRAVPHGDVCLEAYSRRLTAEIEFLGQAGPLAGIRTAYVGGGTPTMLANGLPQLVQAIRNACPQLTELTCEANPESLTADLAHRLADAGTTRLSVGVQSTNDDELKALGRIHTGAEAERALRIAVKAGLDVSADLMCATPLQTAQSWRESLQTVLVCGVGHVSVYPLQIEEGTALGHQLAGEDPGWNSADAQADRMEEAERVLTAAGLARYEVASYARPGKECAHNIAYWTGLSYLGLGPSAAGMLSRAVYLRLREVVPALPALADDVARIRLRQVPSWPSGRLQTQSQAEHELKMHQPTLEIEYLNEPQAVSEDLMLSLRLMRGLGPELCEHAAMVLGETKLAATLTHLAERKLIQWNPASDAWVPTHEGWLLGNELFGALWDLAPTQETRTQEVTL